MPSVHVFVFSLGKLAKTGNARAASGQKENAASSDAGSVNRIDKQSPYRKIGSP